MAVIIVGVDGSEEAGRALDRAIVQARATGAELAVVSVAESLSVISLRGADCDSAWDLLMAEPRRVAAEAADRGREAGVAVREVVEAGRPAEVIARLARAEKADEIVVGSRGKHAVDRLLLGSVSARLVEIAPCTIVVVR